MYDGSGEKLAEEAFILQPDAAQLNRHFPIKAELTDADKSCLLDARSYVGGVCERYSYLEVGSSLGGSLAPFLADERCQRALSIDHRGRQQPDERGLKFDYAGVTHETMLANLQSHGLPTGKLRTFDGSIEEWKEGGAFDLAFIDGEHTDFACFRDFLWALPMMKPVSLVLFHDSTVVYKALKLVGLVLRKQGYEFRFFKKSGSEVSACFLGAHSEASIRSSFGPEDDAQDFFAAAEATMIHHLIQNRVALQVQYSVKPVGVVKML